MTGPELDQGVENLAPYWAFVQCARVALGMQGSGGAFSNQTEPEDDFILKDFRKNGLSFEAQASSFETSTILSNFK